MSNYSYKPIQTYFDAFKRRETITQDVRYPNNIKYAIMDPTNTPPNRTTLYTPNTLLNFDHLHNPYDHDVNPNFTHFHIARDIGHKQNQKTISDALLVPHIMPIIHRKRFKFM